MYTYEHQGRLEFGRVWKLLKGQLRVLSFMENFRVFWHEALFLLLNGE